MKIEVVSINDQAQSLVDGAAMDVAARQAWQISHLKRLLTLAYQAINPEEIDPDVLRAIEVAIGAWDPTDGPDDSDRGANPYGRAR